MTSEVFRANRAKELDRKLVSHVLRFAKKHGSTEWMESAMNSFTGSPVRIPAQGEVELLMPWAMFHFRMPDHDAPMAQIFRETDAAGLPAELCGVLDSRLRAWLSVWEVRAVQKGVGVLVSDLLTGEERFVHDVSSSSSLDTRAALLGLVVDSDGISFFGGVHCQPLPPRDTDAVVRELRKICRVRSRPVKVDLLRDPNVQADMIHIWRSFVKYATEERPRPRLQNTDGDALIFVTDHFEVLEEDPTQVLDRLRSFPGAERGGDDEREGEKGLTTFIVTRPGNARMKNWPNTILGHIRISGPRMRVETNSVSRANSLRNSLLDHLHGLVRYRMRDETTQDDMFSMAEKSFAAEPARAISPQPPRFIAAAKAMKEEYMREWLDESIPALNGLTPREAAKTPAGRRSLELVLREMEYYESRVSEEERFNLQHLRAELEMSE